eukprot:992775-Rhodomonas_salina.3
MQCPKLTTVTAVPGCYMWSFLGVTKAPTLQMYGPLPALCDVRYCREYDPMLRTARCAVRYCAVCCYDVPMRRLVLMQAMLIPLGRRSWRTALVRDASA